MAPRKSRPAANANELKASAGPSGEASSSRVTLDIPVPEIPESITPDHQQEKMERRYLNEEDREKLVQELVAFYPRNLCDAITTDARVQVTAGVNTIESWARGYINQNRLGEEAERELDVGLHTLETLLNSHVDKAFDKFTAWTLRNPFDVPGDLDLVLPWHRGLDFSRGEHVTTLPKGEETLSERLQQLRTKVEQSRLLSYRLAQAEVQLDRRLEIARQRKAEVGFVKEVLASSGLNPLPQRTAQSLSALQKLHATLAPLDPSLSLPLPPPLSTAPENPTGNGVKAWEMGRQAYLTWAVGKVLSSGGVGTGDVDMQVQDGMGKVDEAGLEVLGRMGSS